MLMPTLPKYLNYKRERTKCKKYIIRHNLQAHKAPRVPYYSRKFQISMTEDDIAVKRPSR